MDHRYQSSVQTLELCSDLDNLSYKLLLVQFNWIDEGDVSDRGFVFLHGFEVLAVQLFGIHVVDHEEVGCKRKFNSVGNDVVDLGFASCCQVDEARHAQQQANGRKADVHLYGASTPLVQSDQASNVNDEPENVHDDDEHQQNSDDGVEGLLVVYVIVIR